MKSAYKDLKCYYNDIENRSDTYEQKSQKNSYDLHNTSSSL